MTPGAKVEFGAVRLILRPCKQCEFSISCSSLIFSCNRPYFLKIPFNYR